MEAALLRSLEFRCIGPHRAGRVVAVAGHPREVGTFYHGACAGGVWKTTSGGAYWENVSDGFLTTSAVGAIAVAESDPNVVYVGTGETAIRSNVSHGDGVYRSTDGGRSWTNLGLRDTRHVGRVRIHPHDPDLVYVAALGHVWGQNDDRGVYRSRDGGRSWERVLFKSPRAGAIDLTMDTSNPRVLYAAMWQAQRHPHALVSGGEDSGIWRSLDGGDTWTDITRKNGLPAGNLGKIGVAASPAKPGRVWALVEAEEPGLLRSDDYGESWQRVSDNPELRRRPFYYMHVLADPVDAERVWVLNLQAWRSTDGGRTFSEVPTPHGDNHDLWIDPRDTNRMIEGHDGGASVSYDGGRSWSSVLNQPTAQFYHVTTDDHVPYRVYGSQQDNWAMRLPSIGSEGAITWADYVEPGGGESGYIAIEPDPPHTVYGGGIGTGPGHGRLLAWDPTTRQRRNVTVWPEVHGMGGGAELMKYRFQWTFPIELSPHDPGTLYACSNVVHRSRDRGASWEAISPDLTRDDPSKLGPSGGITRDNSGAEIYCTIFAFRESPHERGVFWAGSDDGLVHVSRNGGANWENVTPPDLPEWSRVMILEPSPHDPATAYLAATRYQLDDTRPYLYKTNDYGATWAKVVEGIPETEFTRVIREDPARRGLLYAGTELGIHVSFDDGAHWQPLASNLPVCPIYDLVVKGSDLVVGTHGRSFWILDDLTPLRQIGDEIAAKAAHLFAPRATTRWRTYGHGGGRKTMGYTNYRMTGPVTVGYRPRELPSGAKVDEFLDAGKNPPEGVIVHYWLRDEGTPVSMEIVDEAGEVVRALSSDAPEPPRLTAFAGANRFVWDFRHEPPSPPLRARPGLDPIRRQSEDDRRRDEGRAVSPRAVPGRYRVRLIVGEESQEQDLEILADPRLSTTPEDYAAQLAMKRQIHGLVALVNEVLNSLLRVRTQIEEWEQRAQGRDELTEAGKALRERIEAFEADLTITEPDAPRPSPNRLREKLVTLSAMIDESDDPPTQGARELLGELAAEVDRARTRYRELAEGDIGRFADQLRAAGVPLVAT